ncbi:hydroxycarboxylic acid receptor 2-like [Poecilia formosa]|uniref:Hydroxycarboxylic acid receptor 2-like n=1 Tax=Poecilia formosa TaxID=48698 RepID=A0A087XB05_POEFO|nr:PREDICTED: hydroxycarboxylic acid receptor 2-like [Poecilia formosa]
MYNITNNITISPNDNCSTPNQDTYQALSYVMIVEFILGLPLNLSVLYIFIFRYKFWKNNSVFLFNIVVADFLLVACLPVKIHHYQHNLRRSKNYAICRLMHFMLFLNRGASIGFLITLSLDRYFSVVHLGRRNCVKVLKKSPLISVLIWVFLLPLTIPTMLNNFDCCNSLGRNNTTTLETLVDAFRETVFFSQIIIPFIILIYCTTCIINRLKRKSIGEKAKLRRAVFAVLSVAIVFSICFLPCMMARLALLIVRLKQCQELEDKVVQVYDALMVLSYADCLLDPLVYCFCNSGFKVAYISTFFPPYLRKKLLKSPLTTPMATTTGTTGTTTTTVVPGAKLISLQMMEK